MRDELLHEWVATWVETGAILEAMRRADLEAMTDDDVRRHVDDLFSGSYPLDLPKRAESGLVEQQRRFARLHRRK